MINKYKGRAVFGSVITIIFFLVISVLIMIGAAKQRGIIDDKLAGCSNIPETNITLYAIAMFFAGFFFAGSILIPVYLKVNEISNDVKKIGNLT